MASSRPLLRSDLYREAPHAGDPPSLLGGRCQICGYLFFPAKSYGCEQCGSTALETVALAGRGQLVSSAVVHVGQSEPPEPPFVVGAVKLADGPMVRALLVAESHLAPGVEMVASLVAVETPSGSRSDLYFAEMA